mmetsp:Transcript_7306/g.20614  ORF Transcript_7306/g.20614 Transcript_7306/m.20614 type:complete len:219 (+) Transcript_7306:2160-2816(+)
MSESTDASLASTLASSRAVTAAFSSSSLALVASSSACRASLFAVCTCRRSPSSLLRSFTSRRSFLSRSRTLSRDAMLCFCCSITDASRPLLAMLAALRSSAFWQAAARSSRVLLSSLSAVVRSVCSSRSRFWRSRTRLWCSAANSSRAVSSASSLSRAMAWSCFSALSSISSWSLCILKCLMSWLSAFCRLVSSDARATLAFLRSFMAALLRAMAWSS